MRLEKDGDEFTLEANSIAFVQVEPVFRLPDYIALRFNLKITHVHRGILIWIEFTKTSSLPKPDTSAEPMESAQARRIP